MGRTFGEFMSLCEASDASDANLAKQLGWGGGASVTRKTGGKIGAERGKSDVELKTTDTMGRTRTKLKPRSDIGTPRPASTRVQQPEKERGSAALPPKEAQRKAYLERKAREGGAKTPSASQLLSKKTKTDSKPAPGYTPPKKTGLTTPERKALYKKGERTLRDIVVSSTGKKSEKELKHKYTSK